MNHLAPKSDIRTSKQRKVVSKGAKTRSHKDLNIRTKVDENKYTKERVRNIPYLENNKRAYKSAKFRFKDGTALANMAKYSMGKFHNEYFPQSMHKLTESQVDAVMKTLRLGYSDDIMSNLYL